MVLDDHHVSSPRQSLYRRQRVRRVTRPFRHNITHTLPSRYEYAIASNVLQSQGFDFMAKSPGVPRMHRPRRTNGYTFTCESERTFCTACATPLQMAEGRR